MGATKPLELMILRCKCAGLDVNVLQFTLEVARMM
jgi:hypothetical protein